MTDTTTETTFFLWWDGGQTFLGTAADLREEYASPNNLFDPSEWYSASTSGPLSSLDEVLIAAEIRQIWACDNCRLAVVPKTAFGVLSLASLLTDEGHDAQKLLDLGNRLANEESVQPGAGLLVDARRHTRVFFSADEVHNVEDDSEAPGDAMWAIDIEVLHRKLTELGFVPSEEV